ncbi:AMP-dependent synthetase/ligase [Penicillium atrosanguineum]|uniref:AMP-dependent synthetase/ligase n=1 Tax=Penicillium atrosanguineum TaxID=1132637 RepID=UPI00238DFBA4|nr:AMP-dependent synthetase/ligase [Penicillium atrosanguineum]KAJ5298114.1 AMP-dependent synthetase/ligase [Penicillium atrosanguineum]
MSPFGGRERSPYAGEGILNFGPGEWSSWPFPYTDQDGNPRLPRTHAEGIQSLIQYAERPGGNQGQLQLPVGGDELARMCTTPVQLAILRGRGRPIWHVRGNINGQQIVSQRPSYINALLIQSRGNQLVQPCEACVDRCKPFPQCIRLPGQFGGCCGNCKWRDHASRCSVRDRQPRNATRPWPRHPPRPLPATDIIDLTDDRSVVRSAQGPSRRAYQRPRADSEVQEITMVDLTEEEDNRRRTEPSQLAWYEEA